jgi:hypothetical protein
MTCCRWISKVISRSARALLSSDRAR